MEARSPHFYAARQSVESLNVVYKAGLEPLATLFLQVDGTSEAAALESLRLAQQVVLRCGGQQLRKALGKEEQRQLWDLRRKAYYACRGNKSHLKTRQAPLLSMES